MNFPSLIGLALAASIVACGTPKKEQRLPAESNDSTGTELPAIGRSDGGGDELPRGGDICAGQASQAPCPSRQPVAEPPSAADDLAANTLSISRLQSYEPGERRQQEAEDVCQISILFPRDAIELRVAAMPLQASLREGQQSARCQTDLEVRYRPGTMFAIRKITVPLRADLGEDVLARFEGAFGFEGQTHHAVEQVIDRDLDDRDVLVERGISDQELQWSRCDGQATLSFEQYLQLSFPGGTAIASEEVSADGTMDPRKLGAVQIRDDGRYRLEIVWARCPE